MLRRSGGVVVVQWTPPVDMGGVALQEYVAQVYNVDVNGTVCVAAYYPGAVASYAAYDGHGMRSATDRWQS